jgi:hypothetical protein
MSTYILTAYHNINSELISSMAELDVMYSRSRLLLLFVMYLRVNHNSSQEKECGAVKVRAFLKYDKTVLS